PATIVTSSNTTLRSEPVTITVVPSTNAVQKPTSNSTHQSSVIARLTTNKINAVVGEKIVCTLRCLLSDDQMTLTHIDVPKIRNCRSEPLPGPVEKKETIDG